jgi:hypothetical protein
MTKLEYLTARYHEVKVMRDRKANEIAQLIGDDRWLMRRAIPGHAIGLVEQWMGYGRTLAALHQDIRREQRSPCPTQLTLH